jgi:hypothetical protein
MQREAEGHATPASHEIVLGTVPSTGPVVANAGPAPETTSSAPLTTAASTTLPNRVCAFVTLHSSVAVSRTRAQHRRSDCMVRPPPARSPAPCLIVTRSTALRRRRP